MQPFLEAEAHTQPALVGPQIDLEFPQNLMEYVESIKGNGTEIPPNPAGTAVLTVTTRHVGFSSAPFTRADETFLRTPSLFIYVPSPTFVSLASRRNHICLDIVAKSRFLQFTVTSPICCRAPSYHEIFSLVPSCLCATLFAGMIRYKF